MATDGASNLGSDRDRFLRQSQSTVDYVIRLCNSDSRSTDLFDSIRMRLQCLKRDLNRAVNVLISEEEKNELVSIVEELAENIEKDIEAKSQNEEGCTAFRVEREHLGQAGAPKLEILQDQLVFLSKYGFTAPMMAEALGTSESTIRRRLKQYGIQLRVWTDISDDDLDNKVKEIIGTNKRIGPNSIRVRLGMDGINVTRKSVRDSCHRIDPAGSALRSLERRNIQRRTYKVAGPNSLWHLYGNHKLIRWGFVIHGAIDGYSRLVTFLHASMNNLSTTVFDLFTGATKQFGIPSRIRVDCGVENNDVCIFMEGYRGANRGSAIKGKSSHNQRIERLWVDLWESITNEYYDLFYFLEETQLLDVTSSKQLWALHFVFQPRLNKSLEMFKYQHNHHGLSTENNRTPFQIFIQGVLQKVSSENKSIEDLMLLAGNSDDIIQDSVEDYGVEDNNSVSDQEETEPILEVNPRPLNQEDFQRLCTLIDPVQNYKSVCHGVEIYKNVVSFLNSLS